ncbi:MAG: hypothetical protein EON60_04485 [Alphaproteobacteria bacterium]|nr:MAG: hypothetical protein EON60_04485 [Alphaproteobacteria bacterium]
MPVTFTPTYNDKASATRQAAIAAGHTRLLAFAYYADPAPECLDWRSFPNEAAMQTFIKSWDEADSMSLNCAAAIAAVNPQDTEETIKALFTERRARQNEGPGFFQSAL